MAGFGLYTTSCCGLRRCCSCPRSVLCHGCATRRVYSKRVRVTNSYPHSTARRIHYRRKGSGDLWAMSLCFPLCVDSPEELIFNLHSASLALVNASRACSWPIEEPSLGYRSCKLKRCPSYNVSAIRLIAIFSVLFLSLLLHSLL